MRPRRRHTLRRRERPHEITQHRRQLRRRPAPTATDDDLDLDRSCRAHRLPTRRRRRTGQIVDRHPDRNRRGNGSIARGNRGYGPLAGGNRRPRCPVPFRWRGRNGTTTARAHRRDRYPITGVSRDRRRQRSGRAHQRKREDQSSREDVHAPTLGAGQPARRPGSPNVDNSATCGYRALHRGYGRSAHGGDFGPGAGPRRLINAVCAQHGPTSRATRARPSGRRSLCRRSARACQREFSSG